MLEKPDLQDGSIITCLQEEYDICIENIEFLPIGADFQAAVYRVVSVNKHAYFLKLKRGNFKTITLELPKFLSDQGIRAVLPAITTKTGQLWTNLDQYTVILYPFVNGNNGYAVALSDRQWRIFGSSLRNIHDVEVPQFLKQQISKEIFLDRWSKTLDTSLKRIACLVFKDPVAVETASFMQANCDAIYRLVERAEKLRQILKTQSLEFVLCHSDIHAGNILIDDNNGFYIVDWDEPIFAPRERDLMYIGGAQGFKGFTPQEEESLFYRGYGHVTVNPYALAYYRYQRIVEDIAIYSEQLLWSTEGTEDRVQSLKYLKSNFMPNSTIDIAYQADKTTMDGNINSNDKI